MKIAIITDTHYGARKGSKHLHEYFEKFYNQIIEYTEENDDTFLIIKSKKNFEKVIEDYPKSDFALDSEYKLELIEEILASKEMYLARYYVEREKWIPAINRYKKEIYYYYDSKNKI